MKNNCVKLNFPCIDETVIFGKDVKIANIKLVNLFGCKIGDNSFIGPFVEITRGVVVGENCIIESHSFLCTGVVLGDNVFVGHGVMFTNDSYPKVGIQVKHPKTQIYNNVSLGTNSTILGGVTIGEFSIIGAGSVVTKDIPSLAIAYGNPAKVVKIFKSKIEMENYIKEKTHDK